MTKKAACGVVFAEANSGGIYYFINVVGRLRGMRKRKILDNLLKQEWARNQLKTQSLL